MDLTTLISMGVDEIVGREALKKTGNVEQALLWLSTKESSAAVGSSTTADTSITDDTLKDIVPNPPFSSTTTTTLDFLETRLKEQIQAQREAQDLLITELGNAIQDGGLKDLEKEWLGADLEEEFQIIEKYMQE